MLFVCQALGEEFQHAARCALAVPSRHVAHASAKAETVEPSSVREVETESDIWGNSYTEGEPIRLALRFASLYEGRRFYG